MAKTLAKIFALHQDLVTNARAQLDTARGEPPADIKAPIRQKEKTVAILKSRVENLAKAKEEAVLAFDAQINAYQADVKRLETEISEDGKILDIKPAPTPKKKRMSPKKKDA
jgi:hypothetical protein